MGDVYRTLLVHGAFSAHASQKPTPSRWARRWKQRGFNKAAVALAAKHARILWALLAHETDYKPATT
jgi:transposase